MKSSSKEILNGLLWTKQAESRSHKVVFTNPRQAGTQAVTAQILQRWLQGKLTIKTNHTIKKGLSRSYWQKSCIWKLFMDCFGRHLLRGKPWTWDCDRFQKCVSDIKKTVARNGIQTKFISKISYNTSYSKILKLLPLSSEPIPKSRNWVPRAHFWNWKFW